MPTIDKETVLLKTVKTNFRCFENQMHSLKDLQRQVKNKKKQLAKFLHNAEAALCHLDSIDWNKLSAEEREFCQGYEPCQTYMKHWDKKDKLFEKLHNL